MGKDLCASTSLQEQTCRIGPIEIINYKFIRGLINVQTTDTPLTFRNKTTVTISNLYVVVPYLLISDETRDVKTVVVLKTTFFD